MARRPAAPSPTVSATQKALLKMGLAQPMDLALHLPLRFEDETRITRLADAHDGDTVQVQGHITHSEVRPGPTPQLIAQLDDGSGTVQLRWFRFYPSQQRQVAVGSAVRARGELRTGFGQPSMLHPTVKASNAPLPTALTPVYPSVAGLAQHHLRKAVLLGLAQANLHELLPADIFEEIGIYPPWNLREALSFLHNPPPVVADLSGHDRGHPAWQRLKAEELLAQQLSQAMAKQARHSLPAPVLAPPADSAPSRVAQLHQSLPFALTGAQQRVVAEILAALQQPHPMHRLLQGDVGSGKTVVAALAATACVDAGWQCALMAPTEILATQHTAKLLGWLTPLGVRVVWLTGQIKASERQQALAQIASGQAQLVVGTHALIQQQVQFARLGLAIIDEQHRFGVAQRLALRGCWGQPWEPHLLMMSATPIPRTLAMSHFADLDVSTLDELPPGRTPVVTRLVPMGRRDEVMARLGAQVAQGRQAYWVCPLIEESEALDLHNATTTHAELCAALPGVAVGLLHARMTVPDKQAVMARFAAGEVAVLVSTTVIEVGVDVPNASLMVIEHAERFGLSQLHQLRGRVGRGATASACVLLYDTGDAPRLGQAARARLQTLAQTQDGFEVARRDLEIRGPGEFLGARQSGTPMLRFADLAQDQDLLAWAQRTAPRLLASHPQAAQAQVQRWLGHQADFLKA